MLTSLHRPRSAGEILDAAFQLYRAHWPSLSVATKRRRHPERVHGP
ncbi:MAG TPA: hypothetical protein VFQ45_01970 [Longimicrobium sp.]|nr:hypothetical protein [Longimicrobium sp.]